MKLCAIALLAVTLTGQQVVDVVAVVSMPMQTKIDLPGELQPFQQAALRAVAEGIVEKVLVDRGSHVAEGDLLATIAKGAEIRAPFAGVITARYVHPGELVGPHDGTLFDLAQTNRLRLVVSVPEENAGSIPHGDITFRVPAFPGSAFHGTVTRSAGALDPKTHVLPVEIDVRNSSGRLLPGMRATASWRFESQGAMTLVPPTAIGTVNNRTFVMRMRNGAVEWIDVVRGAASGELIAVQGGLDPGDLILRQANTTLRPGTHIQSRVR